ncbi:MAG: DUF5677 domain-containing protein [Bacilli bacterium]|nr:DUF5677 domain-containing protein [Bacilli bacterium]
MAEEIKIDRVQFNHVLDYIKINPNVDRDVFYSLFVDAMEAAESLKEEAEVFANVNVNFLQVVSYLANEYTFYLATHGRVSQKEIMENEEIRDFIVSIAVDKYYTNEHLAFKSAVLSNRFNPEISTITLYLNFVLGILSRYKMNDPTQTLLVDMLHKGFSQAKCVVELINDGYETEAFSCWRTLHEIECIFILLIKYGEPVIISYLDHMQYARAFRKMIPDKETTDRIFVRIKEEMKSHDLKSKDMKRFIEYGWLYAIPTIGEVTDFKLNFRDGVERCAGLRDKAEIYEMSSEIAHSSPLLIYSDNRKSYYHLITIMNVYESFFRLEKYFASFYLSKLPEEEKQRYYEMRNKYLGQLQACFDLERFRFNHVSKSLPKLEDEQEAE